MQENDPQSTNIQDYVTQAKVPGEKVIQPSTALIEEMKAAQATPSPEPAQLPTNPAGLQNPIQVSQTLNTYPAPQASVLPTSPSSVYPEVTKGIGVETPAPIPQDEPVPGPKLAQGATTKTIAVKIVAGLLVLINLINAYNWLLSIHASVSSWIDILEIAVGLVLTIGIFSLKESARSLYVTLSAILLVFACIGFITFFVSTYHNAAYTELSQSLSEAQHDNNLKVYEGNKSLPVSTQTKQAMIRQLQDEISFASASRTRQYVSTALLIVTSVGPLIFFTRPSIKAVFN